MLGSHSTTPWHLAVSDTTNLSVKVMSVFPTASGNNGTRTKATVPPTGKKTSIGVGSKNGSSVDNRIEYQLQIKSRCMIGVYPFTGLDYWTEIFSFLDKFVCVFLQRSLHFYNQQVATWLLYG